ncbi:MAG: histidine kinase [Chitinophagaceae bacterium]|nr:histidine kinase [Chitinophagaceae bacterium]
MDFIPAASEKEYAYLYYDSLTHSLVTAVYNEGIYIYDINRRQTRHLLLNLHPSQRGAAIANICGNNKGTIYLADINNGLYRINLLVNDTVKRYTSLQGLPGNICYWCTTDNAGYVWIATPTGVCRMDPEKETFTDFGIDQGHPGNASFLSADQSGNIYQPWMDGYYSWNTSSFQADPPRGKIYLRNCMMNDTALPEDSVYHFAAGENNLSFQFGYLLLSENSTVDLEYRINNAAWLQLPENHAVAFSSLAPGSYHIQVREKKFPDAIFHLRFTIRTPVWARWWFIVLSGMLITAAVYYLFRRRLNTIRKENALKQKIAATEMMALRAQMNPHFIFNCISSIDNFILGNDKENASHYLNQFAKLIRNILDNSKNDVIPFWKDWETLSFYLEIEKLRNNNSFICKMEADETLLNGHYKIPPLVIQPYIENAIHHGLRALKNRQGILTITAKLREGILEYRIEDNGIGREQAAASRYMHVTHQSYGMQLSRERIELFNDQSGNSVTITDLKDDKGEASGTLVVVLLKV